MVFNGITLKDLGITVQAISGVLDMPDRKGDAIYDWGHQYEALIDYEDIYFGTRKIQALAFFDDSNGDFKGVMATLRAITGTHTLITEYGEFEVVLHSIKTVKETKGGRSIHLNFTELSPDLSGGMPTISGKGGVRIDGHDLLVKFGLLVEQVKMFEIQKLKDSKQTSFKNNFMSVFREPQTMEVKVNGIYASKAEMSTKISSLNALLAKEGARHFSHNGEGFQCFISKGYKVNFKGPRVAINLKLNVMAVYNIDQIVEEVVDRVTLQASPQSDLMETNVDDPRYVKGKETFVASDSNKLNGQGQEYYAKEAEIKALRDADLAAELEAETNF